MMLSRRSLLASTACLALGAPRRAVAQEPAASHTFKLGAAEITVLSDGAMSMPLDWVLPGRPREEIARAYTEASKTLGEIVLQVNATLIKLGRDVILVDTGAGPDFAPQRGKLADNLVKAGIKPEDVTLVVFTHAHPDHFWGVVDPLDGGSIFPHARLLMTAQERDYWLKSGVETSVPEAVRGAAIGTQRRLKEFGSRIETLQPNSEIAPGLLAIDTSGHSPGHVSLILQSANEKLMIGGDVLVEPVLSFAKPAWPWGADWDTDKAIKARLATLDRLVAEQMPLLGYHLPWPGVGRVERLASASPAYRFVAT